MYTNMHIWVLVGENMSTGNHVPYLSTFATKKEAQEEAVSRNKYNKIESSFCFNIFFRAVKYVPVWDLKK
jgi:acetylglutamate synthase